MCKFYIMVVLVVFSLSSCAVHKAQIYSGESIAFDAVELIVAPFLLVNPIFAPKKDTKHNTFGRMSVVVAILPGISIVGEFIGVSHLENGGLHPCDDLYVLRAYSELKQYDKPGT